MIQCVQCVYNIHKKFGLTTAGDFRFVTLLKYIFDSADVFRLCSADSIYNREVLDFFHLSFVLVLSLVNCHKIKEI